MDKTLELYYESAYLTEFEGRVLACDSRDDGHYEVILDKTAFFPEQGGQTSDVGLFTTSDGTEIHVSHVSIGDGVIRHICDGAVSAGDELHGRIDFAHRFSNMQQHTGEHIFSGIVSKRFGYDNVGFHLSDSEVTMDYNGPLSKRDIDDIELAVNRAIWENVAVTCSFPEASELSTIDYRSKKELSGDVRIVTVEGYDVCACCAPHVNRTGEIGLLKVVGLQNYKGGVRVSILCGQRALEYLGRAQDIVKTLSDTFTTSDDKVVSSVEKLSEENSSLKAELSELRDKLIDIEVNEIESKAGSVFVAKSGSFDAGAARKMVNLLAARNSGYSGVFSGDSGNYRYVIATGDDNRDLKALNEMLKERYGAKGGGNNKMVQGSLCAQDIGDVIDSCYSI
ncbi:alanyl-tRNA editing protein [Butyrivibrio proteoclasticus]|uniref:alanyl-tRNA editing protein n=1 Tax=Butyrivibrio proteoclasticus TaxID=43305 RepID=UPI000684B855|nr:alanine--tRNA ligase-related protein [Butyrivibrio proteoclasticus]